MDSSEEQEESEYLPDYSKDDDNNDQKIEEKSLANQ